jgi:hypothetical protein
VTGVQTCALPIFYESRHAANLEIAYGIRDELASGITVDMSFSTVDSNIPILNKPTVDLGFYLRGTAGIGSFRFGFRPELLLSTYNGQKSIDDQGSIFTGNMHYLYLSERITAFARYDFVKAPCIFIGAQQKRVLYLERDDGLEFENVFSAYCGFSMAFAGVEASPYLGIPFASDYTETKSPLQLGIKVIYLFPEKPAGQTTGAKGKLQ